MEVNCELPGCGEPELCLARSRSGSVVPRAPDGSLVIAIPAALAAPVHRSAARDGPPNPKLVQEYADVWHDLPPIVVQKGTFRLIDGLHRLHASFERQAGTDHAKIIEEDVVGDELKERAFELNASHGRALTGAERARHLRYLMEFAQKAGVSRTTVSGLRDKVDRAKARAGDKTRVVTRSDGRPYTVAPRAARSVQIEHIDDADGERDPGMSRAASPNRRIAQRTIYRTPENTEPAELTAMRTVASLRDPLRWLNVNLAFADDVEDCLAPLQRVANDLGDALDSLRARHASAGDDWGT